jgi:hypothetical protein
MALSPTGILRAGWVSAKQNIGTFLLYALAMTGLGLGVVLGYSLLMTALGTSALSMFVMGLLSLVVMLGLVGYIQLTGVRLSYLGSGGARVALREVLAWNTPAVGRMLVLYLLYLLAVAVGYLPLLLLLGAYAVVNSSVYPVLTVIGVVLYIAMLAYLVTLIMAMQMATFLAMQGAGAWAALSAGWAMTAGNRWRIVGTYLLGTLLIIVALLPAILIMALLSLSAAGGSGSLGVAAIVSFFCVLYFIVVYVLAGAVGVFSMGHMYRQLGGK